MRASARSTMSSMLQRGSKRPAAMPLSIASRSGACQAPWRSPESRRIAVVPQAHRPELEPQRPALAEAVVVDARGLEQRGQPAPGVGLAAGDGVPAAQRARLHLPEGAIQQRFTRSEVVLDRADGEAALLGDVRQAQPVEAARGDDSRRSVEDLRAAFVGDARARAHAVGSSASRSVAFRKRRFIVARYGNRRGSRRSHRPRVGVEVVRGQLGRRRLQPHDPAGGVLLHARARAAAARRRRCA